MDAMRKNMAMAVFSHPERHHVAILVRQMTLPIELGIVHQLFGQARSGATAEGKPLYEVITCALRAGEVNTDGDFTVVVRHGPEALAEADTVIVLSSYEDYSRTSPELPAALAEALSLIRADT